MVATDGVGLVNSLVVCLKRGISSASGSFTYLVTYLAGSPFQRGNLAIVLWLPFLAGLDGLNGPSCSAPGGLIYWDADLFKGSIFGNGFPYFGTYFPVYGPSPIVSIGLLKVPKCNLLAC